MFVQMTEQSGGAVLVNTSLVAYLEDSGTQTKIHFVGAVKPLYVEGGLGYDVSKQLELGLAVDFERSVSNRDGKGFNGLTIAPKVQMQMVF